MAKVEHEQDKELAEIYSIIEELQTIERENPPDPNVAKALKIVDAVLTNGNLKVRFIRQQILVGYHGSLQYNDPHNLDLDLDFMSLDKASADIARRGVIRIVEAGFENVGTWPIMGRNQGNCDMNFSIKSVEDIRDELNFVTQVLADGEDPEDYLYFPELWASSILTSHLVFDEQRDFQSTLRAKVLEIVQSSPLLKELLLKQLQNIRDERLKRRAEKNDAHSIVEPTIRK